MFSRIFLRISYPSISSSLTNRTTTSTSTFAVRSISNNTIIIQTNPKDEKAAQPNPSVANTSSTIPSKVELTDEIIEKIGNYSIQRGEEHSEPFVDDNTVAPSADFIEEYPNDHQYITGVKPYVQGRQAMIYRIGKKSGQHGGELDQLYHVRFNPLPEYANPLMGWTSSMDPLDCLDIKFNTLENAIHYIKKLGIEYKIESNPMKLRDRASEDMKDLDYSYAFLSKELQNLKLAQPKQFKQTARKEFKFYGRKDTWIKPLDYRGTSDFQMNEGKK